MNTYNEETIAQVADWYNFYAEDKQEFFVELSEFIIQMYLKDGYFDYEIEGLAIDGHKGLARAKIIYV